MKIIKRSPVPDSLHRIFMTSKALRKMSITYMKLGMHGLAKAAIVECYETENSFFVKV
ncbi:unnamed protein product, partial [marine sediment metagenome]